MKFMKYTLAAALLCFSTAQAETPPQRVVSAGGDLTEIIYALGAQDRLVGVDSTSNYPATAKDKKQIGYVRRIAPEGVLSLEPDLVLGAYDMGPQTAVEKLRATGVRVELAPEGHSATGVSEKIRFVGKVLGLQAEAEKLAIQTEEELALIAKQVAKLPGKPSVLFVLAAGNGAPMVGGRGTSAEQIIELSGGINAASAVDGYKPMSQEAILNARPDYLLMMRSTVQRIGGSQEVYALPEFKLTPAMQNNRLIEMDGMMLLGFGLRTPKAIAELSSALHP